MKKVYIILILCCFCLSGFGQTTVIYYANGAGTDSITGYATTGGAATRVKDTIRSNSNVRGYAVFNINTIPAGSTISSVTFGFNIVSYTNLFTAASGWTLIGNASDLSLITSAAALYTACGTGTTLFTNPWDTIPGNMAFTSAIAPATTFIQSNLNTKVSIGFKTAGFSLYKITGEDGVVDTAGVHVPYLKITYCPPAITGTDTVCPGGTVTLSDASSGGTWTSSDTTIAKVNLITGVVTGISAGVATITYTIGTCVLTTPMNVMPIASINPTTPVSICVGAVTSLSETVSGSWSSSNSLIASVSGGVVTGAGAGVATITFTSGGCFTTKPVTVNAAPTAISPSTGTICTGGTFSFSDASTSGSWSSTNSSIATITTGGVATGAGVGTDTIYYSISGCSVMATLIVSSGPSPITPATPVSICSGSTATLADASTGGTWTSSNNTIASVTSGGLVTGVGAGVATITYAIGTCNTTKSVTVTTAPAAITPATSTICSGSTVTLTETVTGGAWTSSATGVASVTTGVVTGGTTGTAIISYTVGTCTATATVNVTNAPAAILPSGSISICMSATTTLTDAVTGGVWSSSSIFATVTSGGVVTGMSVGSATISYSIGSCSVTKLITITPGPALISPATATVCPGSTATFNDAVGGGSWSSSSSAIATMTGSVATGVSTGTAVISYTAGSCVTTATLIVSSGPAAILPAGSVSLCAGTTTTLTDAVSGGAWSSSNNLIATVAGGVVTGVAAGSATITYTVGGCTATKLVTITSGMAPISPSSASICVGSNFTFTDGSGGGTWSSSDNTVATVIGGVVTGVASGTATISYASGSCAATASVTVNNTPSAISPTSVAICVGANATFTDASTGGVWSSSSAVASVSAGVVTGVSAGTATISYSFGTCAATATVNVTPTPTAILPASPNVCVGSNLSLVESVTGGTWTSGSLGIATVSATGVVTGISTGTSVITYAISTCSVTTIVTVSPWANAGMITGMSSICGTGTIVLSETVTGGVWSASNSHATVVGGVVTGVTTGTDIISYTVTNGCGPVSATFPISIDGAPNAGFIAGPVTICQGTFSLYTDASTGGLWSVSNGNATITTGGLATGVMPGAVIISYAVTNSCGSAFAVKNITINPLPNPGIVSGPTSLCVSTSITMSETATGGVWSSSNAHATVIGASGIVTGASGGIDTIIYSCTNACGTTTATQVITVNPSAFAGTILGPVSVCVGSMITLNDAVSGGVWSSSNGNATVIPGTGVVSGVSPGFDTVSYTVVTICGTSTATKIINVIPMPSAGSISGPGNVCQGATISLTDPATGGTWTRTNGNATVTSSGLVTGVSLGVDTIIYTVINVCGTDLATVAITINPMPNAGSIIGASTVCIGSIVTLADTASGGSWSLSNGNATLLGPGIITGNVIGTDMISYSVTNSCGTAIVTQLISIDSFPDAGFISGSSVVCEGATVALSETVTGGVWSSGSSIATVSSTGIVTGVTSGTDTISYAITNGCGTVGTFKLMTISPLPDPGTVVGLGSVCLGSSILLTDAITGGVWSAGNANATVVGGLVTGISVGTDPISYTVTNSCGSVSAILIDTIVTMPTAGTITGLSSVCEGANIVLSDGVSGGIWSINNANASITGTGIVTGVTFGLDTITYTVTNACGTAITNFEITINPSPTVMPINGATSLCVGNLITLVETTTGGIWSSSAVSVATVSSSGTLHGVSAGIATISYTVSNSFGCSVSATISDTVLSIPVSSPIAGSPELCIGGTTTLSNSILWGVWTSSNPSVALINPSTGAITGLSVGTATIYYSVSNSCGSVVDSTVVTVNNLPMVPAISGPSSIVCAGGTTLLTDGVTGGIWSSSDTSIAIVGSTTGVVTGITAGIVTITYTVTSSAGCSNYATFSLTFGASMGTVSVTPTGNASVCHGAPVNMQVVTSVMGLTYQWFRNGVIITGATNSTYSATLGGTYSVFVSNGACSETLVAATVTVTNLPVISFTSPNILSTGSYAHYQWYKNGTIIAGATNSIYFETGPGSYTVLVTDNNGCSGTSAVYTVSGGGGGGGGTSVTLVNIENEIHLYPNPANSTLHLDAPISVNVKIFGIEGKLHIEQGDANEISVADLANGLYIIMIYDNEHHLLKTDKFMKL